MRFICSLNYQPHNHGSGFLFCVLLTHEQSDVAAAAEGGLGLGRDLLHLVDRRGCLGYQDRLDWCDQGGKDGAHGASGRPP